MLYLANSRAGSGRSVKGSQMSKRGSSAKRTASPEKLPKKSAKDNLATVSSIHDLNLDDVRK